MHYDKSMHDVSIHDNTSKSNLPLLSMIIEIGHKDQKQLDNSMIWQPGQVLLMQLTI